MAVSIDADALRRELARRGISQAELAGRAGVSAATLSHLCTGRRASLRVVRLLAKTLDTIPVLPGVDAIVATKGTNAPPRSSGRASTEEMGDAAANLASS